MLEPMLKPTALVVIDLKKASYLLPGGPCIADEVVIAPGKAGGEEISRQQCSRWLMSADYAQPNSRLMPLPIKCARKAGGNILLHVQRQ